AGRRKDRKLSALTHSAYGTFPRLALSPDGRTLAVVNPGVRLWRVGSWDVLPPLPEGAFQTVHSLAFSADSRPLAVGGPRPLAGDGAGADVEVWQHRELREQGRLTAAGGATRLLFAPDGQTLLVYPGAARTPPRPLLWHFPTGAAHEGPALPSLRELAFV